jgi:serine protease SohB
LEFLIDYGLFLAKVVTIVIAIIAVIAAIAANKGSQPDHGEITVTNISDELSELEDDIRKEVLDKEQLKDYVKQQKKLEKTRAKESKKSKSEASSSNSEHNEEASGHDAAKNLFVIEFDGDVQASAVENLREEITAILTIANKNDQVLLKLESPGGMVHSYGLAASQLQRIKQAGLKLTIAVDEVAASGGYMMACVGDEIVAAPFAIIGSIGVLAQIPNFNRLLKKNDIDFEQMTAGEYKRTMTMFGENTDKGRQKFQQELEDTHELFKSFINENRPELDLTKVATGEHWYGRQALELGLIDQLSTSDDMILQMNANFKIFKIKHKIKKPLSERLPLAMGQAFQSALENLWQKSETSKLFK